ncbi:MAG: BamA/TamA family outer membrane protein [Bradymonadaceae bacterium]
MPSRFHVPGERLLVLTAVAALLCGSPDAATARGDASPAPPPNADSPSDPPEQNQSPDGPVGEPLDGDARRPPDYDGRSRARPSIGDVALWIPRVALYPIHLTVEGLFRRPIDALTQNVKPSNVEQGIGYVTDVGETELGLEPIYSSGAGTAASYGLSLFTEDVADGHVDFRIGAAGRIDRNLLLRTQMAYNHLVDPVRVELSVEHERRDDYYFAGLGPRRQLRRGSRYERREFLSRLRTEIGPTETGFGGRVETTLSENRVECSPERARDVCGPDARSGTSDDRYPIRRSDVAAVTTDYTLAEFAGRVYWDTRTDGSGSGVRLQAAAEYGRGFGADSAKLQHVRYGAEASGFWDLFDLPGHTAGLRIRAETIEPIGTDRIPFPELIALGGIESMRGFRRQQFRGQSSILATLNYRYPVWTIVDGLVFIESGHVFGSGFSELEPGLFRASVGIGLRTEGVLSSQTKYDANIAVGTTTFGARPFGLETFRINLGTNWGF